MVLVIITEAVQWVLEIIRASIVIVSSAQKFEYGHNTL